MPTEKKLSRKITQELQRLSTAISRKLEAYFKKNISGKQYPVDFIKQNDKEIKGIIGETVQSSWLFGHTIIGSVITEKIQISAKDGNGIESLTKSFEEQFWTLSHKLLTRDSEFKVENGVLEELTPFDIHAAFVGLGGWFAYFAYNESIESKATEIEQTLKLRFVPREQCIDTKICLPLKGSLYNPGEVPFQLPLHKHCKCRLIPTLA